MRFLAIAAPLPAAVALSLTLASSTAGAQPASALRPCAVTSSGLSASNMGSIYGFDALTLDVQKGLIRALDRDNVVFKAITVDVEETKQNPSKPLAAMKQSRCRLLIDVQGIVEAEFDTRFELVAWPAELDAAGSLVLGRQPSFKKSYSTPSNPETVKTFDFKTIGEDMFKDLSAAGVLTPVRGAAIEPARLRAEYDRIAAQLATIPEVHLRNILVDTEAIAQAVLQRLRDGAVFHKLAREISQDPLTKADGGDMGWHVASTLGPDVAREASALGTRNGLFSRPVETQNGWHVIEMIGQRPQRVPTFTQSERLLALRLRWQDMEAAAARSASGS